MASVWFEDRHGKSNKIVGNLNAEGVTIAFAHVLNNWQGAYRLDGDMAMLYRTPFEFADNKPYGLVMIEHLSPPSAPEKGQPKRITSKQG